MSQSASNEDGQSNYSHAKSFKSKNTLRSRTGGEIKIEGLKEKDKATDHIFQQDEFNRLDIEIQQLDSDRVKKDHIHRYVESLVSGKYYLVKKDFDPNAPQDNNDKIIDKDGDGIVSTQEINDFEMKAQQKIWVKRINNWYHTLLGLLGGVALMSLFSVVNQGKKAAYLNAYSGLSNNLCAIQQVIANFTLVFALTLTLIYRQKADELMKNLDKNRLEFRQQYHVELITTSLITISWVCLQIEPKYTNQMVYLPAAEVTDKAFGQFKILNYIKNLLLLISWFISSSSNGVQLSDVELDPDSDDDEVEKGSEGDDEGETQNSDE